MTHETSEQESARGVATLGALLLDAGESVSTVGSSLDAVRGSLGLTRAEISVLPTLVLVADARTGSTVTVSTRGELTSRQAAVANQLPSRLRNGSLRLDEVPDAADSIREASRPRSFARTVVGNALVAGAFAALFQSPWWAVVTAVTVGLLVGLLMGVFERSRPGAALQPFVVSFLSTVLVGTASSTLAFPSISLYAVVAPVVILVPGAVLGKALLEVTSTDIVAGAARLVGGLVVMSFMLAGIVGGSTLTGLTVDPTTASLVGDITGAVHHGGWESSPPLWAVWLAVAGLACGVGVMFQAGPRLAAVSAAIMCAAYGVTLALTPALGSAVAIGAATGLVFLAAKTMERFVPALPAAVTFFPAFLLFVPGTLALVSLATQSQDAVTTALTSFASLCIGIHIGGLVDLWLDKTLWNHRERTASWDHGTH